MIKNSFILAAATLLLGAVSASGATVNGTNYSLDGEPVHKPIALTNGSALTTGGVVQIGAFNSSGGALDALIAGLTSPAGLQALLADFIAFGESTTLGGQGDGFEGIYDLPAQSPISAGSALIDKSIYTLIGNASTLAGSSQLAIIQDNQTFAADAPLYVAAASLLEATNVVRFGNDSGPSLTANSVFPAAPSLQLAPIPEPMSATLLLSGLALIVRRRRA